MAEETTNPEPEVTPGVTFSAEEYSKLSNAMNEYKRIEMAYLALKASQLRRCLVLFIIADVILAGAIGLGWDQWRQAVAYAGVAFSSQLIFMATVSFLVGKVRSA